MGAGCTVAVGLIAARIAAGISRDLRSDFLTVVEPDGAPVLKPLLGQDMLHFMISRVCVHPKFPDPPIPAQVLHQLEGRTGGAPAPGRVG